MGLLLSYLIIFLVECGLMALQVIGASLFLLSVALLVRRFTTARKRRPDGYLSKFAAISPYLFGGIGFCLLVSASVALSIGKEWGIFGTWVI
ncbi:hypothetical protein HYE82_17280 [Streptomyces sp. BR123]|uniref:hypothetical protein n=1 Tax=Streptomyces sp. BR123 TaxID=2749828 RepID=UPI0015C41EFE|nr:hypothetical protein [Streptomyces sp. BR123]NXY96105.1 hypothetical protein [Streptomyces sp. BR123]